MAIEPFNGAQRYFKYFQIAIQEEYSKKGLKVPPPDQSAKWWMKTLYFACLQSPEEMFKIFPTWEAYPNGPVATEPYQLYQDLAVLIGPYRVDDKGCDGA